MTIAPLKRRTYEVLEVAQRDDRMSQVVQGSIITLILLNVAAFIMATVPSFQQQYETFFLWFRRFSVAVFTVEYVLRVWVCTEHDRFDRPVVGRLRFMATPAAVIDLLAILPFYLPLAANALDLRAIRALRLFRLLRLLKLGRFSQSIGVFADVIKNKKEQLLIAAFIVSVLLVLASSLMYVAEHRVQPEAFSSIPAAMWWGAITLTTVGYGDVTPVTTAGRILGGLIAVLGIGLFALPAGILSSGFEEALDKFGDDDDEDDDRQAPPDRQANREANGQANGPPARYCPHCGERLPG